MIKHLRIQLTVWFVLLVMLVYLLDGAVALFLADARLANNTYQELGRQCSMLAAAVAVKDDRPTLAKWAAMGKQFHVKPEVTVQLFDRREKLLEAYGPPGVNILNSGRISKTVYSSNIPIGELGFIQVQIPTKQHDDRLLNIGVAKLYRALIISIAVGICGWLYSAKAIEPILRSLKTLQTFVADAGHELKTPVTLIEGSLETLEAELIDHHISTDLLQIIVRASARLKNLSNNLLLLARMENPALELRKTLVDTKDLVDGVVRELSDQSHAKGVSLRCADLQTVPIYGDKDALSRMLSNLVENAIRYTQPGGSITASVWKQDAQAFIRIEDSGMGIPPESLPYIFNRFYRVDKARSRELGGSGLGLAIVKAIVDAHGGQIAVDSRPDVGSKFTISLPAATVPIVAMTPTLTTSAKN